MNSQGMIAGLGRRVSSFLFGGGTPSQEIHSSLGEVSILIIWGAIL